MSSVKEIMQDLCKKYGVRQATLEKLLEAENSRRDLRRRVGLPEQLRRIIEDDVAAKEATGAAQEN